MLVLHIFNFDVSVSPFTILHEGSKKMLCRTKVFKFFHNAKNSKKILFHSTISRSNVDTSSVNLIEINKNPIDSFSLMRIQKMLRNHKCHFEDGYVCLKTSCTNCHDKKEGVVFINKTTGCFICMDCQDTGDWHQLETRIKPPIVVVDRPESDTRSPRKKIRKINPIPDFSGKWNELKTFCKDIRTLSPEEIDEIIVLFKLQTSSSSAVLKELDAIFDDTRKLLYFPLTNGKKRIVGIKQLSMDNVEECNPLKQCCGIIIFVPDRVKKKCEDGIVVHNVKDLVALASVKHSHHVICIPHGNISLPQEVLPLFEQYKKLILWFGNDAINLAAARMFSKKLKEERCFIIKETDKRPSVYLEGNEKENISKMLESAEPLIHECITTFSEMKHEIWQELNNLNYAQGIRWRRFAALNEMLKGHRRGELTILTGPTGSGKTTFISEYSLDLATQGVSTLWGSFEIRNRRLAYTMLQQLALMSLNENYETFEYWAREFEKLPMYFLKFHGPQSVELVMKVVNYASYMHDIQHLVIDNLQFMMGLSSNEERFIDRFYKQDKVIAAFRNFATQRNCHVTLIIHPRKEKDGDELTISSIFGSAKASQEADNILILQKKMLESLHIKKYIQILKNRYTGDLGVMPLSFDKATLSFAGKQTKDKMIPVQEDKKEKRGSETFFSTVKTEPKDEILSHKISAESSTTTFGNP